MWLTVPEDPELVFDDDRAQVWTDALARAASVVIPGSSLCSAPE